MGKPVKSDAVPLHHGGAGGQGKALTEKHADRPLVPPGEQGLFKREKDRPPQRVYRPSFGNGIPDSPDQKLSE